MPPGKWRASQSIRAAVLPLALGLAVVCIAFSDKQGAEPSLAAAATPAPTEPATTPSPEPGANEAARATEAASAPALTSFAPIVEKVAPSVVSIHTSRTVRVPRMLRDFFGSPNAGVTQGLGSGVIVSRDGYILTNNHVTDGADDVYVTLGEDRREYKARKIGADPGTDLAVFKIEGHDFPVIPFADSDKVRVGDLALAVGNPFGLTRTVTMGIISGLGRGGMGIIDYENFIQTDASVNPGNSGGALVDAQGRLVGINTAIFSRTGGNQGIGFAVPSNLAMQVLRSIREKGRVERGYLGTVIQPVTRQIAAVMKLKSASGALVSDVTSGSPASSVGLAPGDVIVAVDEKAVNTPRELRLAIGGLAPGTKVKVHFIRDGAAREVEAVLGALPSTAATLPPNGGGGGGGGGGDRSRPGATPQPASALLDGVELRDLSAVIREGLDIPPSVHGAIIAEIDPGSAAYRAGLRQGHVIVEINREPVGSARQAERIGGALKKGEPVLLRVWGGGQTQYLAISPETE